jgi:hypothetical protein
MKLILDIVKTLFSRIVILFLVALLLVAMDVGKQNKHNFLLAAELLKEKEAWIQDNEKNLVEQTKAQSAEHRKYLEALENYTAKKSDLELKKIKIDLDINIIEAKLHWFNKPLAFKKKKELKKLKKDRRKVVSELKKLKAPKPPKSVSVLLAEDKEELPVQYSDVYIHQLQNKSVWSSDFVKDSLLNNHRNVLLILFFGLFFAPFTLKFVNFFLFAPLAKKADSIRINPASNNQDNLVEYGETRKEILIDVDNSASLFVKPGWFNLNTDGLTRTRIFWDWSNPFVSYALGLVGMTEFLHGNQQTRQVKLASEDDPNQEIMLVRLTDHPGYVVKHGHVVALTGDGLRLKKQWRLMDWKSWLFGNIRYVYFQGTGTLYVHGYGSVTTSIASTDSRIKERHIVGFDTRTPFKMARSETFINYWLYNKPLYDVYFPEQGNFLQQQAFGKRDEKIFRSLLEDVLGSIGKVLGS